MLARVANGRRRPMVNDGDGSLSPGSPHKEPKRPRSPPVRGFFFDASLCIILEHSRCRCWPTTVSRNSGTKRVVYAVDGVGS